MGQSQLTTNILTANPVLVSITNRPRRHNSIGSYAEMRSANKLNMLYTVITWHRDYSVQSWGDKEYSIHLRSLLNEQEWLQFKRDILQIYTEQNAKRQALRNLIECNCYRSLFEIYFITINNFLSCICPRCWNPLRDKTMLQRFLECLLFLLFFPLIYISAIPMFVFMVLDGLTGLRFCLLRHHHNAFLESVMTAHPELDPALIEEELVEKLQQLLDALSRHHPGVHCKLSSSVVHQPRHGSHASYDEDVFENQFFAPGKEPSLYGDERRHTQVQYLIG